VIVDQDENGEEYIELSWRFTNKILSCIIEDKNIVTVISHLDRDKNAIEINNFKKSEYLCFAEFIKANIIT